MRPPALRTLLPARPSRQTLARDAVAGIPGAIGSVPDGMASAVLVGVNPIHGLYASFAGPIAGGLTASTRLMVVTTTTAAALAAGSALGGVHPDDRADALVLLTILAGAVMVAAGVARLGRYTRFVSISVMTGFLTGVAVNIVLGQLADLTGADVEGDFALAKAIDLVVHPGRIDLPSLLVGVVALVTVWAMGRTRFGTFGSVVALVTGTLVALPFDSVARVEDVGAIPRGVPVPTLPDFGLISFDLVAGALAVAAIVLVQGAGVAESAPNPDGSFSDPSRDFVAQGAGNLASGFFKGQPVGASVGQTALNVSAGARSRWASVFSGVWLLAVLVVFSGIVGHVAMPTLAAVLIWAAIGSLRLEQAYWIFRTGYVSQIALVTTFLATLFLSVTAAVGIGVVLSLLLQLNREALDLKVVELVRAGGGLEERPAPAALPSRAVTVLDVYGSLFHAGARTLQVRLPDPVAADRPVVVLRLRGRTALGATAFAVLTAYAERLAQRGGRLYLSGVDPGLTAQMRRAGRLAAGEALHVYEAEPRLGVSSLRAVEDAEGWLAAQTA